MASAVTITHAWLTDGPYIGEVRLNTAVSMTPLAGDMLEVLVEDKGESMAYHPVTDRNGAMLIDALGRAVMSCGIRPDLPDLSDPEAVQRWLASDEGPAP